MRALAVALLLASAPAFGDARTSYDAGKAAFDAGNYAEAITSFEEAYKLEPRPILKFALAQAYRFQWLIDGDKAKAQRALDLFRELTVELPDGPRRMQATEYIPALKVALEQQVARTELMFVGVVSEATIALDGGAATGAIAAPIEVAPGTHHAVVQAPGYAPHTYDAVAVEGRLVVVSTALTELPAHISVAAPASARIEIDGRPATKLTNVGPGMHQVAVLRRGRRPWSREVTLGRDQSVSLTADLVPTNQRVGSRYVMYVGLGALVLGGLESANALAAKRDAQSIEDRITKEPVTSDQLAKHNRDVDDFHLHRDASYFMYGAGAALLVTGALLYMVDVPHVERRTITVTPTSTGATASVVGRF